MKNTLIFAALIAAGSYAQQAAADLHPDLRVQFGPDTLLSREQ